MTDPILFTEHETALLADQTFFVHKAAISQKIKGLLVHLHEVYQEELRDKPLLAPPGFSLQSHQFVKGEHLEHFPYQYVDFPRYYMKQEKFSVRSLVWWGHHIVFALILEGRHIQQYKEHLLTRFGNIADRGVQLCLGPSLWEWQQGPGITFEMTSDRKSQVAAVLTNRSFFKLAVFLPIDHQHLSEQRFLQKGKQALHAFLQVISE